MSESTQAMAGFERLMGGSWHMGDGFHEFAWSLGHKWVQARSFRTSETGPVLVGDGAWFWHPGDKAIRGYHVADGMGIDVFEYTTRWEGNVMVNDLVAYTADGAPTRYVETWEFTAPDAYEWALQSVTEAGQEQVMNGRFERRR